MGINPVDFMNTRRLQSTTVETTKLCKRGHPLTLGAVYVDKNGKRSCKTCQRENIKRRDREHREKIRERLGVLIDPGHVKKLKKLGVII